LESLFKLLPSISWHQDEPFGSTSIYAQWHVFALAREHGIKVMLDGQGADEMLAGYHGFFGPRLASLLRRGRWAALWHEMRMLRKHHGYSPFFGVSRMADALMPAGIRQLLRKASGKPSGGNNTWLDLNRLGSAGIDPFEISGARQPSVNALSLSQMVSTNLPMLLHSEDRNSMAHGVEARVPFLDHRLVEFSLGLAEDEKIREGITKRVLRNAMVGVLPEPVRTRMDKLGFVTPEEVWVREIAPALFRKKLGDAVEISNGIVNPTVITHFDEMLARKRPFSHQWWRVISFGSWLDKFSVETT
jgi:asparagine synthase (glutamine-hydrolysing)